MAKRGRPSAASLAVVPTVSSDRLSPPEGLTADEVDLFVETVGRLPGDYFPPEASEQLAAYCRHAVAARDLSRLCAEFSPQWLKVEGGLERYERLLKMRERESRAMLATARALRLTNQSRQDPKTAGRRRGGDVSVYELMEMKDGR